MCYGKNQAMKSNVLYEVGKSLLLLGGYCCYPIAAFCVIMGLILGIARPCDSTIVTQGFDVDIFYDRTVRHSITITFEEEEEVGFVVGNEIVCLKKNMDKTNPIFSQYEGWFKEHGVLMRFDLVNRLERIELRERESGKTFTFLYGGERFTVPLNAHALGALLSDRTIKKYEHTSIRT